MRSIFASLLVLLMAPGLGAAESGTGFVLGDRQAAGGASQVGEQAPLPPAGSPPLLRIIQLEFHPVNQSVIDAQTYLYYIQTRPSRPSDAVWVPYDETAEERLLEDFRRLWNTNFLDDLWIEVQDAPYDNGVVGKHVIFHMEERQRVKIVDYAGPGADELGPTKIDEKLREENIQIRIDSFIDPRTVAQVKDTVLQMLAEKGYQFGNVSHEIREVAGGPKTVHLTFHIDTGPKVKIRNIEFLGNTAVGDGKLKGQMETNKEAWWLSFVTGRGTYNEEKFAEDADKIIEHYRNRGYITARVGEPQLKVLEDTADGETRWVELQIPVTEGERYRVGSFTFEGNTVVKREALEDIFDIDHGDFYEEKRIRKGLEKAQELYGSVGYFEFLGYPDLQPRDQAASNGAATSEEGDNGGSEEKLPVRAPDGAPFVDVTMRMQEGEQYFVNRITFAGNTVTRDNVIRRELRLYEGAVFNTEALKFSVRRINQLGYFKPLESAEAIQVEKTPGAKNQVDVTLNVEEQNRNQLTFGAGVSQFEGFFGQLSFQTSNFMGRGETLTLAAQSGSRAQNYQVAFTEPFMFDRPITAGIDLFKREIRFISQFTQSSLGGNLTFGFPLANFTRMFISYGYEQVKVDELNDFFFDPIVQARNPFLRDSLLIGQGGERTVSKITPSLIHNTLDNPIFPMSGRRYTAAFEMAGLGGNTNFIKPRAEGVWFIPHTSRTSLAFRAEAEYIRPYGGTSELPIFERLFLGGEYSVRGFDIRTIGPTDEFSRLVLGGNKSLLFNAEYIITVAGPVRLVLFYDAGQVRDRGEKYALDAFKTSTGAEIRFFMPVLNVPFRLIFAHNPQREGVFDNNLQPAKSFTFRFAVGSTF